MAEMWNTIILFYLLWCLRISGEHGIYPVEIYTSHEFKVNTSACDKYDNLEVLCEALAYCVVPSVNYAKCNKTKRGVQILIPLKIKCDKITIKCADKVLYERNLLKYKIPTELKSTYNLTDDQLIVNSKAVGIYPRGVCKFQITKHNNTEAIFSIVFSSNEKNGDMYDVTCNFSVPTASLSNGYFDVNISVYPSNLGSGYGRNDSLTIFIGLEVSLSSCNENSTFLNQNINCTCVRLDKYQVSAQPMWYNSRNVVQFNGSSTLSIHEFNNNHVYYCVARLHNIQSNILSYSIAFQEGVTLFSKELNREMMMVISGAVIMFVFMFVGVITLYKHRMRKHLQFTGTCSRGDLTDSSNPFHTVESLSLFAHVEMTNVESCHYVNDVNPDHLGIQSHYYSQVQLPGSLRQRGDPTMSCRIEESPDSQHMSGVNDGYITPSDKVTQTISTLNDGYLTPLDVDIQTAGTTYQNLQPIDGYVTIIDHYSTID